MIKYFKSVTLFTTCLVPLVIVDVTVDALPDITSQFYSFPKG